MERYPPAAAPAAAPHGPSRPPPVGRESQGEITLEEATRVVAYHLWEHAGRPAGDGVEFWLEAERHLLAHG